MAASRKLGGALAVLTPLVLVHSAARGELRQFRVIFGAGETTERTWDGQASVANGRLVRLAPWKFQEPAAVQPPDRWTCFSRWVTARRVAAWEPDINFARSGYLQRPGLLITVDAGRQTTVDITTPQGPFRFSPATFRLGTRQRHLDGLVQVDEVPLETRLSENQTFDDYPAVAVSPDGRVWVAWIQYRRGADVAVIRRYDGSTWHAPEVLSPEPGDFYRVDLAFDGAGRLWVVVGVQVDNDWDLYARVLDGNEWSEPRRLTSAIGSDLNHRLAAGAGRLYLTWQHFGEDGTADIYLSELDVDATPTPVRVSPSPANDWEPAVTVAPDGTVWVAWDSYDRGNYDVFARAFTHTGRGLAPAGDVRPIATSPRYEAHPSIGADRQGRLWVAYHEGGSQWGKDTGYWVERAGSELYEQRQVRVACLTRQGRRFPAEAIQSELPHELRRFCDHTALQVDRDGRVWVFFRHRTLRLPSGYGNAAHRAYWETYGTYYTGRRWSPPVYIPNSFGRNDMRIRTAVAPDGRLWLAWADDGRVPFDWFPRQVNVHAAPLTVPTVPAAPPRLQPAAAAPSFDNVVHPHEAEDVARMRNYRATIGGETYRIVRGDFHRHTDLSHDGNRDGTLQDAYRYALDATALDVLGVTDHDYGTNDYDWWRSQKLVDLYHVPGTFVPMYAYERSLSYPNGHRNIVHAVRGIRPLAYGPGEKQGASNTGTFLYPHLRETNGIAMSHTSATGMGTDWRDNDPAVEPVVEIFQGDRNSYEHEGAPLGTVRDRPERHKGGYRPKGYVWNAWAKGYKLGVQASSDHVSTHCSYTCIYVSDFSRRGILDALKRRHVYAATDNILVDFRLVTPDGEHLMGDIVETDAPPRFRIAAAGTAPIKAIDIIRNNRYVYQHTPNATTVTFEYRDTNPAAGESYYYARILQTNNQVAWASPIWVVRP